MRILDALTDLGSEPRPAGTKKLGHLNSYRIRVGDYRAIYRIDDTNRTVKVWRIGHRKDVYRGI
ncbi:MAG: type II toxin-antitoxin system RelE/ParE family toxin [Chloroflexota bacterium]|nr:type II toxin-antitoxin system RelE/ParE family toxin [Chloroflexota bacterium]